MTIKINIDKETMTIDEALATLDYTPTKKTWRIKSESEKWSEIVKKKNEREMKTARKLVNDFACSEAAKSLEADLVESLLRLAPSATKSDARSGNKGGGVNVFMETMRKLFPEVGCRVSEIDCFVATKYGRGEMRDKIRQNLKSSLPDLRHWIEFDAATEEWVLLAIGAAQPKAWKGAPLAAPPAPDEDEQPSDPTEEDEQPSDPTEEDEQPSDPTKKRKGKRSAE